MNSTEEKIKRIKEIGAAAQKRSSPGNKQRPEATIGNSPQYITFEGELPHRSNSLNDNIEYYPGNIQAPSDLPIRI